MNIFRKAIDWVSQILKRTAQEDFDVVSQTSNEMESYLEKCANIYRGVPEWLDEEDGIKTINVAKTICSETARLTTLNLTVSITGSKRAEWLQEQIDKLFKDKRLRHWVEYGLAMGTVIFKPNGTDVDILTPSDFIITQEDNGTTTGIIFVDDSVSEDGERYYTRLEHHRYVDDIYTITNKVYVGSKRRAIDREVLLANSPWDKLDEEITIKDLKQPLFGIFKTPMANNIDFTSSLGLPIFGDAIEELQDLDIAYSRNAYEIFTSDRTVLLDSDRLMPSGARVTSLSNMAQTIKTMKLPKFVRNVYGDGSSNFYQEINPALNTQTRLEGINALLSQIGYKCGFSNGYFVFNSKTGMVTATQVESDDRRTIQTIKDIRDGLEQALDELVIALDEFANLYDTVPSGDYEVAYNFGDITYNVEEDRARWYSYVIGGKVPFWYFLTKFEGFTEEEAKEMEKNATPQDMQLFQNEGDED